MNEQVAMALLDAAANEWGTSYLPTVGVKYYAGNVNKVRYAFVGTPEFEHVRTVWEYDIEHRVVVNGRANVRAQLERDRLQRERQS